MTETLDYNYLIELEDFPKYFVATDGIYSDKFGKMKKLRGGINRLGYYLVVLSKDRKKYTKKVHRLIAETFIPNPKNLEYIDHINHNKTDNRLENLRWVSKKDNDRNRSISKNNTSGEQGVYFHKNLSHNIEYWVAHWRDDEGKEKTKYFPIKKYGNEAKQLAIDLREKMVKKFYNRPE